MLILISNTSINHSFSQNHQQSKETLKFKYLKEEGPFNKVKLGH